MFHFGLILLYVTASGVAAQALATRTYALGRGATGAYAIAAGDVNNDGFPDVVTANERTNNISVLLGESRGGFGAANVFDTGAKPRSVALADFNRDGKLDAVTADYGSGTVSVLFGNGTGSFGAPLTFSAGIQTQSVAAGDLNGDGIPDIMAASVQSMNYNAYLSNGDGTFKPPVTFVFDNGFAGMTQIKLGDMNQDGILDVVGIYGYGQSFQVWTGKGDGSFSLWSNALSYGTIGYPQGLALGDFNGDGKRDVLTTLYTENLLGVALNQSNGDFFGPVTSSAPRAPILLAAADLNGDGKLDAVSTGLTEGRLALGLGVGDGSFQAGTVYNVGVPTAAVAGDFSKSGLLDIAYCTATRVGLVVR